MIETRTDPISVIAHYNRVGSAKLRRWYKDHMSNVSEWDQGNHCHDYLLYPKNVSPLLAIDEVSLNQGELVTIVSNRRAQGRKGKIVAMINGTKSKDIERVLKKLPKEKLLLVRETTLDMAKNMALAVKNVFPQADMVIDRFHVIKMIQEALQHLRVKHRWKAIEQENDILQKLGSTRQSRKIPTLSNGDTLKQLLARSRYILYKSPHKWTESQKQRAHILFELYPDIKRAYYHVQRFRNIYEYRERRQATEKLLEWFMNAQTELTKEFSAAVNSLFLHLNEILNFFNNRSTNAAAESCNAQIKAIRATQKGVSDYKMFLFRIEKLFT